MSKSARSLKGRAEQCCLYSFVFLVGTEHMMVVPYSHFISFAAVASELPIESSRPPTSAGAGMQPLQTAMVEAI